jgi:hypothetical protein
MERHWMAEAMGSKVDFSFAYLNNGAAFFLELGRESTRGSLYTSMAAITFSAFCLEAYLNEMGSRMFRHWRLLERPLSMSAKVTIIAGELAFTPDYSSRPFQALRDIRQFRNLIAHSKPGDFEQLQSFCNVEKASRLREDMREMVLKIHHAAGFSDDPFILMSSSGWGIQS